MPWTRGRSRTSTDEWRWLKRDVIHRDGLRCAGCGATGCTLELDHRIPHAEGGTDALANLQLLCGPCHEAKTQAEANRGKARRAARRRLPTTPHPGLR